MQRLMILRHAAAEPRRPDAEDFPRALSEAGRAQAACVARWLSEQPHLPDDILCSPAQRARETLAPLLAVRPELESRTTFVPQIYGASARTLAVLLDRAFAEFDGVLIVGHNPALESLALDVIAPSDHRGMARLAAGTLLIVELERGWPADTGRGRLTQVAGSSG